MAKGLRSKSKRAFRRIKRENPKSDYNIRDKIRTQRLSEKLKELKAVENSDEETVEDGDDAVAGSGDMTLDDAQPSTSKVAAGKQPEAGDATAEATIEEDSKPVSTSGPRKSSRMEWRKRQGMDPGRQRTAKNSTTFAKPKSFKSTAKAGRKTRRKV